jgi:hypothetical protein
VQRPASERVFLGMKKILAAAFLVALTATPAVAQKEDSSSDLAAQDCARARKLGKECVLTFGKGETIEGGVATGEGEGIDVRDITSFSSLIRIRSSFIAEIIRAAEDM